MSKIIAVLLSCFTVFCLSAQTITNGDFNAGTTGWGCAPEIGSESTYGGSGSNAIAEIDQSNALCQTISGFTVGAYYNISVSVSRRTTCGPVLQEMNVVMSGGALTGYVSRNGTGFAFVTESFNFVATSTTHTLSFVSITTGTCNLIVDNIALSVISPLPVELAAFEALLQKDETVNVSWSTASENRNDYFTLDRSADGSEWKTIAEVKGQELSQSERNYKVKDQALNGISYYRLSQTDLDGTTKILQTESVNNEVADKILVILPNPATDKITVYGITGNLELYDMTGKLIASFIGSGFQNSVAELDISGLEAAVYLVRSESGMARLIKR